MDIEETRKKFEHEVFSQHFFSTIEKTQFGGCLSFMPNPEKTMFEDELLARDGDDYAIPEISAMWFGWKKAIEYASSLNLMAAEVGCGDEATGD